jgi:hypothetical protein
LALYDILGRYRGYVQHLHEDRRTVLRGFVTGYAATLRLYRKSMRLVMATEDDAFLRAKLNEADAKFDLPADFFEDVLLGACSLRNYWSVVAAGLFWSSHRRVAARLGLDEDADCGWLLPGIAADRRHLGLSFLDMLWRHLRRDWRGAWRKILFPVRAVRQGSHMLIGLTLSNLRVPGGRPAMNDQTIGELAAQLRPGDILLTRFEAKVSSALLPGFWSHAAIYLGGADQLLRFGVPAAAGPVSPVEAHGYVIEAVPQGVRIYPLAGCVSVDHVAVLRPTMSAADLDATLREAVGHLGKPYDFDFDFNVSSRIVCTELVYRSYHGRCGLLFRLVKRLGRWTLSADDLVRQALDSAATNPAAPPLLPAALWSRHDDGSCRRVDPERIATALLPA